MVIGDVSHILVYEIQCSPHLTSFKHAPGPHINKNNGPYSNKESLFPHSISFSRGVSVSSFGQFQ
jgi:hypothetical protein